MTRLILIPSNLSQEFPNVTISNPQRIRILAQVKQYIAKESNLYIDKVPTITSSSYSTPIQINIFDILEHCSTGVLIPGAVVNIDAFYDGSNISPVEIYEVNGGNLTVDNVIMMEEMRKSIGKFD